MAASQQSPSVSPPGGERRQLRAERILDAAAELIARWGYDKTTIDDIARRAGVAKGTIYLHWRTREDLFGALLYRENARWLDDFAARLAADPHGSTLRGVLKHSALALMKRPLLKALLLRDLDVVGKFARGQQSSAAALEKVAGFNAYLQFLRDRELVRTDLTLHQEMYVLSAVFFGFFLVGPILPEKMRVSDEDLAELMAETAQRALESDRVASSAEEESIATNFGEYLRRYAELAHEQSGKGLRGSAGGEDGGGEE
jgi:AcrR family transcriptional regulator